MTETIEPAQASGRDDGAGSRPHVWPCRHCDMVDDYRLNRENEAQLAEGVFRQDEDYRLTTFKQWLQAFEWDSQQERYQRDTAARYADQGDASSSAQDGADSDDGDPWAAHWSARWAGSTDDSVTAVPAPRAGLPVADELTADGERAEQLRRWHTDDQPADTDTAADSSADSVRSIR